MSTKLTEAMNHWGHIAPLLTPLENEADYRALVESLDAVLDAGGENENHPLAGLAALMGDHISAWESAHRPMPPAMSAPELLAWLMNRDGLTQSSLPEIGSQSVVSEILAGKRTINLRQVKMLSTRFWLPMEMFA